MNYLYVLIIISAAVFAAFSVLSQISLNKHTDMQVNFLIAANAYNYSPLKTMAKRTAKYFIVAAGLLFIFLGITAVIYSLAEDNAFALLTALYVYGISLAAYAVDAALILFCANVYVKFKMRYTPIF